MSTTCLVAFHVCVCVQAIAEVQERLDKHKQRFRRTLGYPKADYTTVSGVQVMSSILEPWVERFCCGLFSILWK